MKDKDIRWRQRFNNFTKALSQLDKFIAKGDELNELETQCMIQAFEYNFELAWNVIKDYYEYQGATDIQGSRDAFRLAFNRGLITEGEAWMNMVQSRTKTSHTCNEATANEIAKAILEKYHALFKVLHARLTAIIADASTQPNM
ncbi:MAG: nucleotidyltransferase [Saprospiraceae bacterium]|nr:MAG: nucleotidyltransferase [Saprospiraceae bacterium]